MAEKIITIHENNSANADVLFPRTKMEAITNEQGESLVSIIENIQTSITEINSEVLESLEHFLYEPVEISSN